MENEQLQNLIVAIEALIKISREGQAASDAMVKQLLNNAKIDSVQGEAILAILQQNKQKLSDNHEGRKLFHAEQLQALEGLKEALSAKVGEADGNITIAIDNAAAAIEAALAADRKALLAALAKINTPKEGVQVVKVENLPQVQKVEVINQPVAPAQKPVELAKPKWYEPLNYVKIIEGVRALFSVLTLKVKHEDILRVNVIDEKGKVINDFNPVVRGGGGGSDSAYLKNKDGQAIDPATEEKQDQAIAVMQDEVEAIGEQTVTIKDLYNQLSFLLDRLDFGLLTDNAKRLKINIEAGTLPVVTTVSSVTSMTNQVRQGDLQMQRVNEALLDTAFINGITNNISIT